MAVMVLTTFGEWLYETRKQSRFSQDELASRADVSKNYISRLERNEGHPTTGAPPQPSRRVVEALAGALGKPISEALQAAGYTPSAPANELTYEPDPDSDAIAALYSGLPPNRKSDLLTMARLWHEQEQKNETTHGKKVE
jgi:transcriptional regulator with XRE-family HTH domain